MISEMSFSHYDTDIDLLLLREAGFAIERA